MEEFIKQRFKEVIKQIKDNKLEKNNDKEGRYLFASLLIMLLNPESINNVEESSKKLVDFIDSLNLEDENTSEQIINYIRYSL